MGQFPSIQHGTTEAATCLSLERSTAAVFHMMRIMEVGLRALITTVDDSSEESGHEANWPQLIDRLNRELKQPGSPLSNQWGSRTMELHAIVAHLSTVKAAWRNPTMHVGVRYTLEEAQDIWTNVRAFMRSLAKIMKD